MSASAIEEFTLATRFQGELYRIKGTYLSNLDDPCIEYTVTRIPEEAGNPRPYQEAGIDKEDHFRHAIIKYLFGETCEHCDGTGVILPPSPIGDE